MRIINKYCGHKQHETVKTKTLLGEMIVYNYEKYKGQAGTYCPGQDDVSQTLINTGYWEKSLLSRVTDILSQGDKNNLIFDVGSHIGWYSKMAENFGYMVNAYDAIREHLQILKKNAPSSFTLLRSFDEKSVPTCETNVPVELLKIDIEGSEQHAIRYFEPSLHLVKNIIMEVSPVFNDSYPELLKKIVLRGFHVMEIDGSEFNFDFSFKQKDLWLKKQ